MNGRKMMYVSSDRTLNNSSVNTMAKIFCFLAYQGRQIQKGGIPVLVRKIYLLLKTIVFLILGLPLVVIIRLVRPFIVIRLGALDIGRLGGLLQADWYISESLGGMHLAKEKNYLDIFYFLKTTGRISNQQWCKMWKRALRISPLWKLTHILDRVNKWLPGYEAHVVPMHDVVPRYNLEYKGKTTLECIMKNKKPSIAFKPEEEQLGRKLLNGLGIEEGKSFICFHARDSVYLKAVYGQRDWSYHDYRDSNIKNYIPAVEKITEEGIYALRTGAEVAEKLPYENPLIIDYAKNGARTDFLDIYLGAKCRFFLCSDTGMSIIPEMFRRPVVYVNWVPLLRISTFVLHGLLIPKRFYHRQERRTLSFGEIINSELGSNTTGEIYEEKEIELIENTPEEILDVTVEMDQRLKGDWISTQEDEDLQSRFWSLLAPNNLRSRDLRIGTEYLRKNKDLI